MWCDCGQAVSKEGSFSSFSEAMPLLLPRSSEKLDGQGRSLPIKGSVPFGGCTAYV